MGFNFVRKSGVKIPIATKLILGFLLIIVITSAVFSVVGVQLVGDRIVSEAQEKVRYDLNAAREIYLSRLSHVNDVVRFTAERFFLRNALLAGDMKQTAAELRKIGERERLDILTVTDKSADVLLRATNPNLFGDSQRHDELLRAVMNKKEPLSSTCIVAADDLRKESPLLAERAFVKFVETPRARIRKEQEEASGLMLKAAAPVFDSQRNLIGMVYGGVLLNRNFEIVDKIKQTVFQDVVYDRKDIGTATIFLDDLRISTNVKNENGSRAVGTRCAEDVYDRVVKEGQQWIGRAYVVTSWRISAYEPITNISGKIIGILYVGILEQVYTDMRSRTILVFLAITIMGGLVSMGLSYFVARKISASVKKLAIASREIGHGPGCESGNRIER